MDLRLRVYGSGDSDLESAAQRLGDLFGPGEPHESLYRGGDYFLRKSDNTEYILQENRELETELAEPDHPDARLSLYITAPGDSDELERIVRSAGFAFLRAE